jgi:hypothetical protein
VSTSAWQLLLLEMAYTRAVEWPCKVRTGVVVRPTDGRSMGLKIQEVSSAELGVSWTELTSIVAGSPVATAGQCHQPAHDLFA